MAILDFTDVLKKAGIDPSKVKLIRHALTDKGFRECYRHNMVYEYTQHQKAGFSAGYDYWAVFISDKGTLAKFYALYRIGNSVPDTPDAMPAGLPDCEKKGFRGENVLFTLIPDDRLREYENKLTIDWGKSTRMWHQKGSTVKPIVSIIPDKKIVFSGYEDLVLSFDELAEIVANININDSWKDALSSVYAIYVIVDTQTGNQYIGSATGRDGLLGRWTNYVETHHGGNLLLAKLLEEHPERYHSFQFSILQIISKTASNKEVVELESLYKRKLRTIDFGLNGN